MNLIPKVIMAHSSVLVYKGPGASEVGCMHLMSALRSTLDSTKHEVQFITPEAIIKGSELYNAGLVAFGGGYTSGFASALGESGLTNLRDYVLRGGAYFGLGAGGYFGCDYIEFDKGGSLEKFSERDLRFYPGIGIGPVYPGFKYSTNQGVNAAAITFHAEGLFSSSLYAFIDGGGKFQRSNPVKSGSSVTDIQVLARFEDLDEKPSAIVKTRVDKGMAVLSGVHLEYDAISVVNSDSDLEQFRDKFCESEEKRKMAFKTVLELLNLHTAVGVEN